MVFGPGLEDLPVVLGALGQLHPRLTERFDLPSDPPILAAELDFETLLVARGAVQGTGGVRAATPSRYPSAERDVAVLVDQDVEQSRVAETIRTSAGPLLVGSRLFDVYQGPPIPAGRKSLAYSLTYQASDRTLSDEEVASTHRRVEQALVEGLDAEIRGREELLPS
jgi:phenylalanyl-tRNA synthetase beta chain